jgi:hypothetical protein
MPEQIPDMIVQIKTGLNPDGIYIYDVGHPIPINIARRMQDHFKSYGLKNVIIIEGGKFINAPDSTKIIDELIESRKPLKPN